ncbi:hypothetical protein [Verrucomicrobium spinosum]|uniref:hypothetical protein n=1 Tax=Verrucomicrobium spinosum TaxID=2736 RepID=UPI0001744C0B|nr:hypothetical protein [Verrucomicrobium spinosum]
METKKIAWLLTGGIGVAWGAAFAFSKWNEHAFHSMSDRGTFGDSFGAFNAVVGGLGFAAVAYSLYCQQKQISQETADRKAQDDKEDKARKEQDKKVDRQIEAMSTQAAAMTKLAEAMAADAELARLVAEFEVVERSIVIRSKEVPSIADRTPEPPEYFQELRDYDLETIIESIPQKGLRGPRRRVSALARPKVDTAEEYVDALQDILRLRRRRRDLIERISKHGRRQEE